LGFIFVSEVLAVVTVKNPGFWDVTLCSQIEVHRCFGGTYSFHLQDRGLQAIVLQQKVPDLGLKTILQQKVQDLGLKAIIQQKIPDPSERME
jgi:hypothetical protein